MRVYAGKTADERRAERRARLIATGRRLFGTQGYHATSMRGVLREAALQDRYFSESFGNMEDLLAAVHQEIDTELLMKVGDPLDLSAKPSAQIRQLFTNLVRELENDPGAARIKLIEVTGVSPRIDAMRLASLRPYVEATYIRLPEPPSGSKLNRMVFAHAFASGTNGMFVDWASGSSPLSSAELIDQCTLLFEALEDKLSRPHP